MFERRIEFMNSKKLMDSHFPTFSSITLFISGDYSDC